MNKACDCLVYFLSANAMSVRQLSKNFVIWKKYVHFLMFYSTGIPTLYYMKSIQWPLNKNILLFHLIHIKCILHTAQFQDQTKSLFSQRIHFWRMDTRNKYKMSNGSMLCRDFQQDNVLDKCLAAPYRLLCMVRSE